MSTVTLHRPDRTRSQVGVGPLVFFFSYGTVVAVFDGTEWLVTTEKHSVSTTRHVREFVRELPPGSHRYLSADGFYKVLAEAQDRIEVRA